MLQIFSHVSSLGFLPTSPDQSILWLWTIHNIANRWSVTKSFAKIWIKSFKLTSFVRNLAGDATEDPAHPKIQWPSDSQCPTCRYNIPLTLNTNLSIEKISNLRGLLSEIAHSFKTLQHNTTSLRRSRDRWTPLTMINGQLWNQVWTIIFTISTYGQTQRQRCWSTWRQSSKRRVWSTICQKRRKAAKMARWMWGQCWSHWLDGRTGRKLVSLKQKQRLNNIVCSPDLHVTWTFL